MAPALLFLSFVGVSCSFLISLNVSYVHLATLDELAWTKPKPTTRSRRLYWPSTSIKKLQFHFEAGGKCIMANICCSAYFKKTQNPTWIHSGQWDLDWHLMDEIWGQLHGAIRVGEEMRNQALHASAVSVFAMNKFHYFLTFYRRNCLMTTVETVLRCSYC